ncbi:MAG: cell division protein SepF [Spiroplasma poulsonii]|uniref:Cell division protein SepF n=1 Tax=Spiroplasma poulsonii TaxID=2138 RepID=A0A2P6FCD1_9MOLU|nr:MULTISPECIES: cell division protein SepF [Spiroplasma]KAF0851517.1 Cell division protein SepF [Spiroplasma poulsonii]MBH8622713.1 cell division protein SepF [Spiroplasma sp. hyd1]MBW1241581.1 cell division protein SepF [Spiroplasma poulsonii]MBW3058440.1 cell division protein SepF [Spiroplasma poulsonii]PQM31111.1 Cell division protein SepF [Spiroplasma poulsonii]
MSIFKKKPKSIYDSQPRIDFNDTAVEPIVQTDRKEDNTPQAPTVPFQKVTFDASEPVPNVATSDETSSTISTGFVADSYNDAPKMADLLLSKGQLVVHLEKLSKEERIRLLDFMAGVMYAFDGDVQKLEHKTYQFMIRKDA